MTLYKGTQEITPIIGVKDINNQDKTITSNGVYTADSGYTGLGEVTVDVSETINVSDSYSWSLSTDGVLTLTPVEE